jgi:hypothetical protein
MYVFKGYPRRVNLVKEDMGILHADFHNIFMGESISPVTFILNVPLC